MQRKGPYIDMGNEWWVRFTAIAAVHGIMVNEGKAGERWASEVFIKDIGQGRVAPLVVYIEPERLLNFIKETEQAWIDQTS